MDLDWAPVHLTRMSGPWTDAAFEEHLAALQSALDLSSARARRFVAIMDMSEAQPMSPLQRRALAEWGGRNLEITSTVVVGIAFCTPSLAARGLLTALSWFRPPPVPQTVVSSLDDAVRWSIERLEEAGIAVPLRLKRELGAALPLPPRRSLAPR